MNITKKIISVLMVAVLLFTVVPMTDSNWLSFEAEASVSSGSWYDISWTYNEEEKELVFSGEGGLPPYDSFSWLSPFRNSDIESVVFEEGITGIGICTFEYCSNLKNIKIPSTVTNINDGSIFCGCTALENIIIDEDNEYYSSDENGIYNIDKTELIYCISDDGAFSDTVTVLGSGAFTGRYDLAAIVIPEGITAIGSYAFGRCTNLESLTIPASVTEIGKGCFSPMYTEPSFIKNLTNINYKGTIKQWNEINIGYSNDILFEAELSCAGCDEHSLTVTPAQSAVCTQDGYTESVYCNDCEMYINESEIIPADHVDENLDNMCDLCGKPVYIDGGEYNDSIRWKLDAGGTLFLYGEGRLSGYDLQTVPWQEYINSITSIVIGEGITEIRNIFDDYNALESVTVADTVTNIKVSFRNCSKLDKIIIPDEVLLEKSFWETAYYNDENNWQDGILYINKCLVKAKTDVTEVSVKEGTKVIAPNAFYGCNSLESITIPIGITYIDYSALYYCDILETIYFMGSRGQWGEVYGRGLFDDVHFSHSCIDAELDGICDECGYDIISDIPTNEEFTVQAYVSESATDGDNEIDSGYEGRYFCEKYYTFIPEETGNYTFKSIDVDYESDASCKIYDTECIYSVFADEGENFELTCELEKGKAYYLTFKGCDEYRYEVFVTFDGAVEEDTTAKDETPATTQKEEPTTKPTTTKKEEPTTKAPSTTKAPVTTSPTTTAPTTTTTEKETPVVKPTKPAKVKIKKPKSTKKKQIVVTWNKVKNANGYQVAYSTSKKFVKKSTKTKLIKKAKTTKTTLKKLKSGKKYFIKVRAYKTVNSKKVYGAYSKVMNVKVK